MQFSLMIISVSPNPLAVAGRLPKVKASSPRLQRENRPLLALVLHVAHHQD
jgi:hypothetical protein